MMSRRFASRVQFFTIIPPSSRESDLNLPGNLDRIRRLQIESVDDLDRIAIEKRKQRHAPASKAGIFAPGDHQIAGADEHRLVEIDFGGKTAGIEQRLPQIRNFQESEARHQVPQSFTDIVDYRARRAGDARRGFEYDAQCDGVARQDADKMRMIHDEPRYLLRAAGQEYRRSIHARNRAVLQVG